MTRDDTRIIFSNIAELAIFADTLVERLEDALGSVLDGGTGDDHVGALFLELVSKHAPAVEELSSFAVSRYPLWNPYTRRTSHDIPQPLLI